MFTSHSINKRLNRHEGATGRGFRQGTVAVPGYQAPPRQPTKPVHLTGYLRSQVPMFHPLGRCTSLARSTRLAFFCSRSTSDSVSRACVRGPHAGRYRLLAVGPDSGRSSCADGLDRERQVGGCTGSMVPRTTKRHETLLGCTKSLHYTASPLLLHMRRRFCEMRSSPTLR